ncbi:hypothetical protein AS594_35965 [Streptomyces agglomeratus]|uniref:Uncharacterized protein n=1 Tax=Streptomyces agglomeratus TaxID=285458 RepID=A0A1E5PI06_9ACTN|nr:hypothetical protein AS594_35965 [Streptomyces agglomeratus]
MRAGTIAAIVFGIGSVVLTGVATYFGAMVAKDQLEQSQEDADRRVREQASRVSFWKEGELTGERLYLMNRSPDPVTNVILQAEVNLDWRDGTTTTRGWRVLRLALQPCSVTIFERNKMSVWGDPKRWGEEPEETRLTPKRVSFTDHGGAIWERRTDGSLHRLNERSDSIKETPRWRAIAYEGEPNVKPVEECGSSGS